MLSMRLSLEGRLGSLTGTQLSWLVMKIQPYSPLRGCNCLENSLLELGTGASFLVRSDSYFRPFHYGINNGKQFHFGK